MPQIGPYWCLFWHQATLSPWRRHEEFLSQTSSWFSCPLLSWFLPGLAGTILLKNEGREDHPLPGWYEQLSPDMRTWWEQTSLTGCLTLACFCWDHEARQRRWLVCLLKTKKNETPVVVVVTVVLVISNFQSCDIWVCSQRSVSGWSGSARTVSTAFHPLGWKRSSARQVKGGNWRCTVHTVW